MINDYNVTDYYNDYCYNNYYRRKKQDDEMLAEKWDRDYEDREEK